MKRLWPSAAGWMVAVMLAIALPSLAAAQERERPNPPSRVPPAHEPAPTPAPAPPPPPPPSSTSSAPPSPEVAVPRGGVDSGNRGGGHDRSGAAERARSRGEDSAQPATARERNRVVTGAETPSSTATTPAQGTRQPTRRYPAGEYSGVAVPRGSRPPHGVPGWNWDHPAYYHPSYWYWAPVGWGLGSWIYYDPFWWGTPSAYSYGYGGYGYAAAEPGSVKIKVKPKNAQVFVDGYYVGIVDEFDGAFQKLRVEDGPHRLEVRLDGFEPLQFNIFVTPDRTITVQGELRRLP